MQTVSCFVWRTREKENNQESAVLVVRSLQKLVIVATKIYCLVWSRGWLCVQVGEIETLLLSRKQQCRQLWDVFSERVGRRIAPVELDEMELNGGQTRYTQTGNVERQTDRQIDRQTDV